MSNTSIIIKKQIHCPASYYFCSGYIPELAQELIANINNYKKNNIEVKSILMNDNTYNWMFRLFGIQEKALNSNVYTKYLFTPKYPIKIISNSTLDDGIIIFNTGEYNELEQN